MNFEEILGRYGLYLTTYVVGVASGLLPFVNLEVYLVWVAAATPRRLGVPVAALATLGQMTAKSVLYLAGAGIPKIAVRKPGAKLNAVRMRLANSRHGVGVFVFLSGFLGVPPFYLVSLASGGLGVPFPVFFFCGIAGRFLRFGTVVFFPHLIKGIFG